MLKPTASLRLAGGIGQDSILGSSGDDLISGGAGDDTLLGGPGDDTLISHTGSDFFAGDTGADTLHLGNATYDNIRQTVLYSTSSDGRAPGGVSGADTIITFDANANNATDDSIQLTDTLKTALDDDADAVLDYSVSNGLDGGNETIAGAANQEATVLLNAEIEVGRSIF